MAGAAFGDVAMSLFVAGAIFGDVGVSLFVASAVRGEIWIDSRSTKCYNFRYTMRCRGGKSNLGEWAGSVLQFHAQIMLESAAHCK